jgi:hypothetical protein
MIELDPTPKRNTPKCPLTGNLCGGSGCARFVPVVTGRLGPLPYPREVNSDASVTPTGLGVCADNLRAEPWVDVAAGVKS